MTDIKNYETFVKIEPINKGWSSDKKYYIETADGQRMILRVSDISELERKKTEYGIMECVYELGVLTSQPFDFGLCDGGKSCYSLSGWLDGEDAEKALPFMSETEQYLFGMRAGEILRKIHTLPAPENAEPWGIRFRNKIKCWIEFYNGYDIKSENAEFIIKYIQKNSDLLDLRPQTFCHGDFWIGNLIIASNGEIGIIDFNSYNSGYGDPWSELIDAIIWGKDADSYFLTGLFRGYFGGEPPHEFFKILPYYFACHALAVFYETAQNHSGEPEDGRKHMENILRWFDDFKNTVPTWYLKDFHVQYINGIPCKLKEPYVFSFINKYGKVFKIFDEQASGCICFGVSDGEHKYFIKFAGVITINNYDLPVSDAIARLKAAVPKYKELAHPLLINLIEAKKVGSGYMLVFDWFDGESFSVETPMLYEKFSALPIDKKIYVFEEILRFHEHVAKCGYVAMDFNDYSTLYNFDTGEVKICDIDFYAKQSYINGMGKALGDPVIMSPEEFRIGGLIDEISNVYTMGATAFRLFSESERDRSPEKWTLSLELYAVVKKAVSDERDDRQQSIEQLIAEWRAARRGFDI